MVEQIDQLVRDEPRYSPFASRISGLVFDSAPCYMSLRVGATAIGYGMPWPLRVLAALLFFLSVRSFSLWVRTQLVLRSLACSNGLGMCFTCEESCALRLCACCCSLPAAHLQAAACMFLLLPPCRQPARNQHLA